jgi:hypothetical protein
MFRLSWVVILLGDGAGVTEKFLSFVFFVSNKHQY